MKIRFLQILFLFLFVFICESQKSYAVDDTTTIIRITRAKYLSPDSIMFQLEIQRKDVSWRNFANATFNIVFDDTTSRIADSSFAIESLENYNDAGIASFKERYPDIPALSPLPTPDTSYYEFNQKAVNGRFFINVLGPKDKNYATEVIDGSVNDSSFTIGTYLIRSKLGELPRGLVDSIGLRLQFKEPYDRYQYVAYKADSDQVLLNINDFFTQHDNIEIGNPLKKSRSVYQNDTTLKPGFKLHSFYAQYMGSKKVSLRWRTSSERFIRGYMLIRGLVPFNGRYEDVVYDHVVAKYDSSDPRTSMLKGEFESTKDKDYIYNFDESVIRGANYCYKLISFNDKYRYDTLSYACVYINNSLISKQTVTPNPFERRTQLQYTLEDDAIVSIKIYDLSGKLAKVIKEDEVMSKGSYVEDVLMPEFATNGIYDCIMLAVPVEKTNIERSTAVVKMQVIR